MRALTKDEFMKKVRRYLRVKRIKSMKLLKSETDKCYRKK